MGVAASPIIQTTQTPLDPEGTLAPANARGAQVSGAIGAALQNVGGDLGQLSDTENHIEVQKLQAQQDVWLSQAKSAAELSAQSLSETAQRSAKPGQPILPDVQSQWDAHKSEQLDAIDNPILKSRYSEVLSNVGGALNKSSQSFDVQQQDAQTIHNLNSTVNNKASLYNTMTDREAITNKAQTDLGELTSNINALPLPPDKRMEMLDSMRKGIVLSALDAKTAISPIESLNENAPARSPQAFMNDPNTPRGIRNNNPGNLEGDQGFKGFVGLDDKGYAKFDSPDSGLRAMAINLRNQQDLHGLNTVEDIVTKYAPPNENNTAAYIANVSKSLNVGPQDPLDLHEPQVLATLTKAVIKQEQGAIPVSDKQVLHAAMSAIDPSTAGEAPSGVRPDGGVRTGDPLFALLKPEEQQAQIQHMEAVYRQQQYFKRQSGAIAGAQLSTFEESLKNGYPIADEDMASLKDTLSEATPAIQARGARLITRNESLREFTPMAPVDLQNYLQDSLKPVIDSGKATPAQVERYDVGTKLLKTMDTQARIDPLSLYSRGSGQPIPALDNADAGSFNARSVYASSAQQLYNAPFKAFTPTEAPRIAESFKQATPEGQRAFLTNFARGFGPNTADAATQVWGKEAPEIAYAATMLAQPNLTDAQAAVPMGIIAGAQRIAQDKDGSIPINKIDAQMQIAGYDKILPPGSPAYDNARVAARALFASRFNGNYSDSNVKDAQQAITDVMGPIVKANGLQTIPPYSVPADSFQKFVENMTQEQFLTGLENAKLTAGNIEGPAQVTPPKNDDGPFDAKRDKVRLKPIANGLYQLVDKNMKPYINDDKTFAILRYNPQDIH